MELTYRCNVRCKHCYLSFGHTGIAGLSELTFEEIRRIIDEIVEAGTLYLLLTGGEPIIRRDFLDIYRYAKTKGLLVILFTNGTMLTPSIADVLAEYRPHNVEITLYGFTQQTYESVTGVPGSHARCYQGIDLLLERDIKLGLKTVVLSINQHEFQQMKTFSEERGLSFRYDPLINPGLNGECHPNAYRLKPEEIVQLEFQDPSLIESFKIMMKSQNEDRDY